MKYLFLFFCLIICSCEHSEDWDCHPIIPSRLSFNSQEGIDSTIIHGYRLWFSDVQSECESIEPEKIECSWVSAKKSSDSTIIVSVKQNNTSKKRYKSININGNDGGGGKCSENSGWLEIIQCPELTDMELSKEELLFSSEDGIDSVIVTTGKNHWLNYPDINVSYEGVVYVFDPNTDGFNFSDYVSKYINDPWFNINTIDEKLIFSINRNESGKARNFIVSFPGDCKPSIKVIQSAE